MKLKLLCNGPSASPKSCYLLQLQGTQRAEYLFHDLLVQWCWVAKWPTQQRDYEHRARAAEMSSRYYQVVLVYRCKQIRFS